MKNIARKEIRRFYYIGSLILLTMTAVLLSVPIYFSIEKELQTKIHQLEESIIHQKKIFLKTVIVEKITDIKRLESRLKSQRPELSSKKFLQNIHQEVKSLIHNTELPDQGYIWINEIVNFNGGDNYAIRFAHPNLINTEGTFLSTKTTDIKGNFPYLEELEGIKKNGEIFFDYYFKKMNSDLISHKLTYAKLYSPYNWVIATGVYLDDVDALVLDETEKMKISSKKTLFDILKTITIAMGLLIIMIIIFENRIEKIINAYLEKINSSNTDLRNEQKKLKKAYKQIEDIAYTDFLTGLWNRRAMLDRIKREISRSKRQNTSFGILMCDIDFFKNVNDTYGHEAGDHILKEVTELIKINTRVEDSISRWGGEEFLAMIVNVDNELLKSIAEKLRLVIEKHKFIYNNEEIKLTITIGLTIYSQDNKIEEVINIADKNLFIGKKNGRNTVIG